MNDEELKPNELCERCRTARAVEHYHNIPVKYCDRCALLQASHGVQVSVEVEQAEREVWVIEHGGTPVAAGLTHGSVDPPYELVRYIPAGEFDSSRVGQSFDDWRAANPEDYAAYDAAMYGERLVGLSLDAMLAQRPASATGALRRIRDNSATYLEEMRRLIDDNDLSELLHHVGHVQQDMRAVERLVLSLRRVNATRK